MYCVTLKALNVDKYSVLGWCSGGCTAIIMASKAVDRVEKLVVWSCNTRLTKEDLARYDATRDVRIWPDQRKRPLFELYGEEYVIKTWKAWVESCRTTLEENDGNICSESLSKVHAPTLILHGAQDGLVPAEHSVYLHENIKSST